MKYTLDIQKFAEGVIGNADIGTLLLHAKLASGKAPTGGFKKLVGVRSTPATGGEPDRHEVTELDFLDKAYVQGRKDTPAMAFTMNHTAANMDAVNAVTGDRHAFLIKLPSGAGYLVVGTASAWNNGVAVNSAVEDTFAITAESSVYKSVSEVTALEGA